MRRGVTVPPARTLQPRRPRRPRPSAFPRATPRQHRGGRRKVSAVWSAVPRRCVNLISSSTLRRPSASALGLDADSAPLGGGDPARQTLRRKKSVGHLPFSACRAGRCRPDWLDRERKARARQPLVPHPPPSTPALLAQALESVIESEIAYPAVHLRGSNFTPPMDLAYMALAGRRDGRPWSGVACTWASTPCLRSPPDGPQGWHQAGRPEPRPPEFHSRSESCVMTGDGPTGTPIC